MEQLDAPSKSSLIGQKVKVYRLKKKLTQAELAEEIGISVVHVSHIETGKSSMSLSVFLNLLRTLEIDANSILAPCLGTDVQKVTLDLEIARRLQNSEPRDVERFLRLWDAFCHVEGDPTDE